MCCGQFQSNASTWITNTRSMTAYPSLRKVLDRRDDDGGAAPQRDRRDLYPSDDITRPIPGAARKGAWYGINPNGHWWRGNIRRRRRTDDLLSVVAALDRTSRCGGDRSWFQLPQRLLRLGRERTRRPRARGVRRRSAGPRQIRRRTLLRGHIH